MSAIAAALEGPLALHHQQRAHNTRTQLFLILNLHCIAIYFCINIAFITWAMSISGFHRF